MNVVAVIAVVVAVIGALLIIAVGVRFLLSPDRATRDFGVDVADVRALTAIKGVRDVTSGLVPLLVWAGAGTHAFGWALIAASVTPWGDMLIVLRRSGQVAAALGIHALTAALVLAAGIVLVLS